MKRVKILSLTLAAIMALSSTAFTMKPAAAVSTSTKYVKASNWSKAPSSSKTRKDTLVVCTTDMSGVWSKEFGNSSYDFYACELMFDYMINPTADGKIQNSTASYKISKNGLVYTFTLKKGIKYWDGKAATANDWAFWLYVQADPNFDGMTDLSTANIKGFDAYKKGSAKTISGIKVVNNSTLQVTLTKASAAAIWTINAPLMEKAYYGAGFKKGDAKAVEKKLVKPEGTGAYKFVSYNASTGLKLTANNAYFGGKPKIKNIQFSVQPQNSELQSVQTGSTDLANATCNNDNMALIKKQQFIDAYYFPTNGYGMVQFNLQDAKYKDKRVRQALVYALNRQAVIKQVYGDYATINSVPIPMASWGWTSKGTNAYNFNLSKAKALLNQAGWKLNPNTNKLEKDGKPFIINFTATATNAVTKVMLPAMKQSYSRLGITVNIETADFDTILKGYDAGKLDATFLGNALASPDPDQSTMFLTGSSQNYYNYSNKALDKLIKQELSETNTAKRTAIFTKINQILNDDLPIMTIYQRDDLWVLNGRIKFNGTMGAFRDPFLDLYKATIR